MFFTLTMKLIDTHAHLDFPQFEGEIEEVIKNSQKLGVDKIVNIGCDQERAKTAVKIAKKYKNVFATVGLHPSDINEENFEKDFAIIEELATSHQKNKIVGIGECGLDFFKQKNPPIELQKKAFRKHIELAIKINKPVIIHFRDAKEIAEEFFEQNRDLKGYKFVVHCFSENLEFAKKIIDWGGMISFTGIVTFLNAGIVQEVAKNISLDKIMIETDCPFLAPQKYRGQRCEPAYVLEVAKKIAELKEISVEEVAKKTTQNAENFFLFESF